MLHSAWRSLAVVLLCSSLVRAQPVSQPTAQPINRPVPAVHDSLPKPKPEKPVVFLHDRFHLSLVSEFAAARLGAESRLPGELGLTGHSLAARLVGVGYRQNSSPFQAGEFYTRSGAGEELGVRADRRLWEAEALSYPPSGADDPALLPGPYDSAYFMPVPLNGYQPAELSFWRDPVLPDSASATARYTNGPAGYSYTGGRMRSQLGAGFETDAQVYRIFSDGIEEPSHFDGHNLDLELRKTWGSFPTRLRFRQNRAVRDLLFRWQQDPSRAEATNAYLTNVDLEAALPGASSEWLVAYHLRVTDQQLKAVPTLSAYQYWFERTHRLGISRVSGDRLAYWAAAWAEHREEDPESKLPASWSTELEGGVRLRAERVSGVVSFGVRSEEHEDLDYRVASALRLAIARDHAVLLYAGSSKETPSTLRRYLAYDSGATQVVSGEVALPQAEHATAGLAWQYDRPRLSWNVLLHAGASDHLSEWQPAGDTATISSTYRPVPVDRKAVSLGGGARVVPISLVEVEGTWRHEWLGDQSEAAAFSPSDSWWAALRVPLRHHRIRLVVTPEVSILGVQGGTLPEESVSLSAGVVGTLKHLTVFWFRDNVFDEPIRTGGAFPEYGVSSRYGFRWNFWN